MSNEDNNDPYNPAEDLEIPIMQPRGADLRGAPRRQGYAPQRPQAGEIGDPEPTRVARAPMTGQRPVQGLGAPQPFAPEVILNQAHGLLEQYKRDPSKIDEKFVQIMTLQALGTFGSQATQIKQLTSEVARLRKAVESMGVDDEGRGGGKRATARDRILARKAANGRQRGGGLRGRFARG